MKQLYALLVGINDYSDKSSPRIPNLRGCENDVKGYKALLKKMFPDEKNRQIIKLLNNDATYDGIIKYFGEDHLLKAGKGDVVLFAYSGHGSRELADDAFKKYFPEGKMETLVCYDSREPGGLDLADKELAVLIKRIADRGAHVCVILDCCHSGSGTRFLEDLTLIAREAPLKKRKRRYDQFLGGYFAKVYPNGEGLELPAADHILLAACDQTEKAYEGAFEDGSHGMFSATLQEILLEQGTIDLSYRSLYTLAYYKLFEGLGGKKQTPQVQAFGFFNAFGGFLNQSEGRNTSTPAKVYYRDGHWRVNRGVLNGNLPNNDAPFSFDLWFEDQSSGKAIITHKGVEESIVRLDIDSTTSPNTQFKALTNGISDEKMIVPVLSDDQELVLQAKEIWESGVYSSRFFECIHNTTMPISGNYYLWLEKGTIKVVRNVDNLILKTFKFGSFKSLLAEGYDVLEHIGGWERIRNINNRQVSDKFQDKIDFKLILLDHEGKEVESLVGPDVVVYLPVINGKPEYRYFKLAIVNNSTEDWYCGLGYLSDEYGAIPLWSFNKLIPAGETVVEDNGNRNNFFRLNPGEHEYTNIIKLFVSKEKCNLGLMLALKPITLDKPETLNRSAKTLGQRYIGEEMEVEDIPDIFTWFTKDLIVKVVAQSNQVGEQAIEIKQGAIKIHKHSAFRSGISLSTLTSGGRNLNDPNAVLADFIAQSSGELLSLSKQQKHLGAPNLLLLNDMVNEDSLNNNSLVIDINAGTTAKGDLIQVLPLAFDGEHIVPVGEVSLTAEGINRVTINSLPENPASRSLWRAAGFCFLKLALDEAPFLLRRVDYGAEKIRFTDDGLSTYVKKANDILLVVHGIIGNTKSMAKAVRDLHTQDAFDLVVAFDYENLNTKIEDIAEQLAEKLEEVGITGDSGKKITILAHSMGGLVSRYFIEHLSGKAVVKKLVMAGTPNGGSELAKSITWRDQTLLLLTLALNMSWNIPALASIIALLAGSKKFTVTLDQMNRKDGGKFLSNLNRGEDPGIPYYTVAGDVEAFFNQNPEMVKLSTKVIKKATDLFYRDEPNDLAVSIASVNNLPVIRNPRYRSETVVGHHLNYFADKNGLEMVEKALLA